MFTPEQARTIISKSWQPGANLTWMLYKYLYGTNPALSHRMVRELLLEGTDGEDSKAM